MLNKRGAVLKNYNVVMKNQDLVDLKQLSEIVRFSDKYNDPLIRDYFEETQAYLQQVEKSIKDNSSRAIQGWAHAAKGASRLLGMTRVAKTLEELEMTGAQGKIEGALELVAQARQELLRTQNFIKTLV